MLTKKENYLRVLRGEIPEYIPEYTFGKMPGDTEEPTNWIVEPIVLRGERTATGRKDIWGVEYVATYETGGASLPKPNDFVLEDITKWRDVVKAPDISDVDWEKAIKKQMDELNVDRSQTTVAFNLHFGYFQQLMALMGFTEGLMAMIEEPEEVKALLDYLCTFYCTVAEKSIDYIQPDVYTIMDDTAAWANPFISPEMYRELIKPFHDRQLKFGRDRGLPITMHDCGRCEDFIEDWREIGVTAWDPAQTSNDLDAIKKKYGRSFVISGGWDASGELALPGKTDEDIYISVKETFDRLAPGGGYCFCGGFIGPVDDENTKHRNKVLRAAVRELGSRYY